MIAARSPSARPIRANLWRRAPVLRLAADGRFIKVAIAKHCSPDSCFHFAAGNRIISLKVPKNLAWPTERTLVLTVDLSHVTPSPDSRHVLRLRDRITKEGRVLKVTAGSRLEVPYDAMPGPANQTVVWVDEIGADGESNSITPRIRVDALKHVAQVERWLRQPAHTATAEEAAKMLEILRAWEYFGDSEWQSRVMRIVKDLLRKLRGIHRLPPKSRLALLCELYPAPDGYSDSVTGNVLVSLKAIMQLQGVLARHGAPTASVISHVASPTTGSISVALKADLRELIATSLAFNSPATSSRLLRGQVLSVIEGRSEAVSEFRAALSSGRELVKSFYLDMGSLTYGLPAASANTKSVPVSWHGNMTSTEAAATILYSANTPFLRRYLARILFYASAEPELHLHFHLVASDAEALAFIDEAEELARTIHGFSRRSSMPPTLSWSSSELPVGVGNPVTYFACARYLVAEQVMERFGTDVWVQDVDLYPTSPISRAHTILSGFDVVLAASTGINMLAPWRRYIANNVYIARSEAGRAFASNAAAYITAYLDEPDSWMLDQNALDWAVEKAPAGTSIANMRALDVQLTQSTMNGPIES